MFDSVLDPENHLPHASFAGVTSDTLRSSSGRWMGDRPSPEDPEKAFGISPGFPGQPENPLLAYEDDDEAFEDDEDLDDDEDEYLDDENEDDYDGEEDDEDEDAYFFPDDE